MAGLCSIHKELDLNCKVCTLTNKGYGHTVVTQNIFVGNNIEINELIELLEKHRAENADYKEVTVYFSTEKYGDISVRLECEK